MPSHYAKSSSKSGTHKMPDGTIMSGKTHSKSSRPVKKNSPKKSPKKDDDFIGDLKEGSLKRMLKIGKEGAPLKISELQKLLKMPKDKSFMFRGKEISKLTPLMEKRINTAITLIRLSKKK
jgi:hypothetical protein